MKKVFASIIVSIIVGSFFGNIMFNRYDKTLQTGSNEFYNVYFIQQGVYSSYDSMINNTKLIESYIYMEEDNLYRVFIGVTKDEGNSQLIQKYYKEKNIDTIVKEYKHNNISFLEKIEVIDAELSKNNEDIKEIVNRGINAYKESGEVNEN